MVNSRALSLMFFSVSLVGSSSKSFTSHKIIKTTLHPATYRTFTKTSKVLALLLEKFENLRNTEVHKKTLLSVLHLWLDAYPDDFDDENLQTLLSFTSSRLPNSNIHMKALNKITDKFERYSRVPPLLSWNDPTLAYQNDIVDHFNGLCLSPAFRGAPANSHHLLNSYRFPNISVKHFAEQLTRMDMELFKRLIPHQCLGETWSHRDKVECGSVLATVAQFNAVSYRVISTILIEPKLKAQVS